jgi:hypothetical protein
VVGGISVNAADRYVTAYSEVLSAIDATASPDRSTIDRILDREHGRWMAFSALRLRHFGFHFNIF